MCLDVVRLSKEIRIAVIAIAPPQGIGAAHEALVVAVHIDQFYNMPTKKAVLQRGVHF
jgi:hypothetical protein